MPLVKKTVFITETLPKTRVSRITTKSTQKSGTEIITLNCDLNLSIHREQPIHKRQKVKKGQKSSIA